VLMVKYARKGPDELGLWPVRDTAPLGAKAAGALS